jgi:hypothetical protein
MKMRYLFGAAILLMVCCVSGTHGWPGEPVGRAAGDSDAARGDFKGNTIPNVAIEDSTRTQLLVLATPHLRVLGDKLKAPSLEPLLEVLQKYDPSLIGVESMSPSMMARFELTSESPEMLKYYAHDNLLYGKLAQKVLGISRDKAESEAGRMAAKLQDADKSQPPGAELRENLVLQFVASYDLESAALQWSYLPEETHESSKVVPKQIGDFLNSLLHKTDEKYQIAVPLARRLGLQQIGHIDDHLDDLDRYQPFSAELMKQIGAPKLKEVTESPFYKDSQEQLETAVAKGNLLPYYLFINSQAYSTQDINSQWGFFLRTNLPSRLDRTRVIHWEARNLEIAAHIREAMDMPSGKRMLVIIGAAHKPYLDTYLRDMMDIRIRSVAEFAAR